MKIGLDAHVLGKGKGGVERYVAELCHRLPSLAPEDYFYFFINSNYQPKHHPVNVHWVRLWCSDPLVQRSIILPWLIRKLKLDLIHTQRIAPLWSPCPVIVSIHDILPLTHPQDYPGLRHGLVRLLTSWTTGRARALLTVSQTVKGEIEQKLPLARGRTIAVYNGVDHEKFKPASDSVPPPLANNYILYAGAIEPRKNLEVVLDAYNIVCTAPGTPPTLVLVGKARDRAYASKLLRRAELAEDKGEIIFTGHLGETQFIRYLHGAAIFLAPSRGEGFDLPPLEAMASLTPVVCSDIEVHRELFDGAALFFQTNSAMELSRSILALSADQGLAGRLQKRGADCAELFSWETTACQITAIYREIEADQQAPL